MTYTGGPVPLGSADYVSRSFEREMISYVNRKEWVLLLGPRQHGKSSALIRLRRQIIDNGMRCAFVDLQNLPPGLSFAQLSRWFGAEVAASLGVALVLPDGEQPHMLRDWLSLAIPAPGSPVVIIIDEASAIRDEEIRNSFFAQIRAIKTAAANAEPGSLSSLLQFVFAGTFRPETLVNEHNSPFNVCRRVETDDLRSAQIETLAQATLEEDDVARIAAIIYDYVGGQPHLVQHLLGTAGGHDPAEQEGAIHAEYNRMIEQGNEHIDSVFRTVVGDDRLTRIATEVVTNGAVANDAANVDYKYAVVVGLLRRDQANLIIRNRLYKTIAESSPQLRPGPVAVQHAPHFFAKEVTAFAFIRDEHYREISWAAYNGAIASFQARHYRLALVAFGVALEAMLIDFLERQTPATLAPVVRRLLQSRDINFNRFEDQNDPSTWRLVNQMPVARNLRGAHGPAEIPEVLRELRNLVHPKVMKDAYQPELALQPDAVAAAGLIGIVMRDIQ